MSFYFFTGLYLSLTLCSLIFSIIEYKISYDARKAIVFCGIIILSIMMGLRPLEVPDTMIYYKIFNQDINLGLILRNGFIFGGRYNSIEYLYYVLMIIAQALGISFSVFMGFLTFGSTALIITSLSKFEICLNQPNYKLFRKQKTVINPELKKDAPIVTIWATYLCLLGYMYSGVAIRSGLSMALGLFAIYILLTHNSVVWYFVSALMIILGTSIQTFGVLFVVIICLIAFFPKIERKHFIAAWIVLALLLLIGFGEKAAMIFKDLMLQIREIFGITAFSSYIMNTEFAVGKWEWYYVLVIGFISVFSYQDFASRMKSYPLIIIGMGIISILYPFMAVSRLADYFMLFLIPTVASYSRRFRGTSIKHIIFSGTLLLLLPIQLTLIIQSFSQ